MSASLHIDKLFADFFENAKEIGRVEARHTEAFKNHDLETTIETREKFFELYTIHYSLLREIHEAYEIKERSKSRFRRLFNK